MTDVVASDSGMSAFLLWRVGNARSQVEVVSSWAGSDRALLDELLNDAAAGHVGSLLRAEDLVGIDSEMLNRRYPVHRASSSSHGFLVFLVYLCASAAALFLVQTGPDADLVVGSLVDSFASNGIVVDSSEVSKVVYMDRGEDVEFVAAVDGASVVCEVFRPYSASGNFKAGDFAGGQVSCPGVSAFELKGS